MCFLSLFLSVAFFFSTCKIITMCLFSNSGMSFQNWMNKLILDTNISTRLKLFFLLFFVLNERIPKLIITWTHHKCPLIYSVRVILAWQMCERTHTWCVQMKLGTHYIMPWFNSLQKWEICSICLVSLKDHAAMMSWLHAISITNLGEPIWRPERVNADILSSSHRCHIADWEII